MFQILFWKGDDGDPLIIDYKLAGISSILTNPCSSDTGTPELSLSFSRVDTYFDWILEYVDLEGEDYFEEYFQYLWTRTENLLYESTYH